MKHFRLTYKKTLHKRHGERQGEEKTKIEKIITYRNQR